MTGEIRQALGLLCYALASVMLGVALLVTSDPGTAWADLGDAAFGLGGLAAVVALVNLGRDLTRAASGSSARH